MSKYIEIYSYHRNRERYPNPASFTVSTNRVNNGIIDPVSDQLTVFPNPNDNPPLVFYLEYLSGESGLTTSFTNLPYMYSSGFGDNIIRLDELPIGITNENQTSLTISLDYPRSVIPLRQIENSYINKYLENVNTGETRLITDFTYKSDDKILQTAQVLEYNVLNPNKITLIGSTPFFSEPLSNIPYYYQGKYIRVTSTGEEQLIVEFLINEGQLPVFILENPFNTPPTPGDDLQIISKNEYLITVDSPFSTSLPSYPVFRIPLPTSSSASYSLNSIDEGHDDSTIQEIRTLTLLDGTVGIAVNSYSIASNFTYLTWYYQNGDSWNSVLLSSRIGRWDRIDATLTYGIPTIVFHAPDDGVTGQTIWYIRAQNESGSVWSNAYNVPTVDVTYTEPTDSRYPIFIRQLDSGYVTLYYSPYTGIGTQTELVYTYLDPNGASSITGSTGWSAIASLGQNGIYGDVIVDSSGSPKLVHVVYQDDATNDLRYIVSTNNTGTAWATPTTINSALTHNVVNFAPKIGVLYEVDPNTFAIISRYFVVFPEANSSNVYISMYESITPAFYNETLISNLGDFNDAIYRGVEINFINNNILQTFFNGTENLYTVTGNIIFNNPDGITLNQQLSYTDVTTDILDNIHTNTFDIASSSFITSPFVGFGIEKALQSLISNSLVSEGVRYRIRENNAYLTNTTNTLISGSNNTFTLLENNSNLEGKYIWIYNTEIGAVTTDNYRPFNDFRRIISWDENTNTGTVSSNFSNDLLDILGGTNVYENSRIVAFDNGLTSSTTQQLVFNWVERTAPTAPLYYREVIWVSEVGLFVASGYDFNLTAPNITYSSDGINWTTVALRDGSSRLRLEPLTYSPELGLFVALPGASGTTYGSVFVTSNDGINWTEHAMPSTDYRWRDIIWVADFGLFIAVNDDFNGPATSMYSSDGINWTLNTSTPASSQYWNSLAYSPELGILVATGDGGETNNVMTTTDGINWTTHNLSFQDGNYWFYDVEWSSTLGIFIATGYPNTYMISTNGTDWTDYYFPIAYDGYDWITIKWIEELGVFITTNWAYDNDTLISKDGINWTTVSYPGDIESWVGIAWAPEINTIAAVSEDSNSIMTTFSPTYVSPQTYEWPAYLGSVSDGGSKIFFVPYYFDTDVTTELQYLNTTTLQMTNYAISTRNFANPIDQVTTPPQGAYAGGALCPDENRIYMAPYYQTSYSTNTFHYIDTVTNSITEYTVSNNLYLFAERTTPSNEWTGVHWNATDGVYVAVSQTGTNDRVMTSPDGVTWTSRTTPSPEGEWQDISSITSTIYVAVGNNGAIMTSTNAGVTWTNTYLPAHGAVWEDIAYNYSNRYVAVASTGTRRVMFTRSGDHSYWRGTPSADDNVEWRGVVYDNTNSDWYAVGNDAIMTSVVDPPVTWTSITAPGTHDWQAIAYDNVNDVCCAVANGVIMYSNSGAPKNTWTTITASPVSDGNWVDIIFDGTRFVAVASSGTTRVMYSTANPPTSWTAVVDADLQDSSWSSITYSFNDASDQYVIVGTDGTNRIGYTATGDITNWTTIPGPRANEWSSVVYDSGYYIAVSGSEDYYSIIYSDSNDPTSWNLEHPETMNGTRNLRRNWLNSVNFDGIAYSSSLDRFVVCGSGLLAYQDGFTLDMNNFTTIYDQDNYVVYIYAFKKVYWVEDWNLFVLLSDPNGNPNPTIVDQASVLTSPDGINWTVRSTLESTGFLDAWRKGVYSPSLGMFIAVGHDSVIYSYDGITWTRYTTNILGNWMDIDWSESQGRFVMVTRDSSHSSWAVYSTDGLTWNASSGLYTMPFGWGAISYSPDLDIWVAAGSSNGPFGTNNMAYSNDGITWMQNDYQPNISGSFFDGTIEWIPAIGRFIAGGFAWNNPYIGTLSSIDGKNWYPEMSNRTARFREILYYNNYLITSFENSADFAIISTNDLDKSYNALVGDSDVGIVGPVIALSTTSNTYSGDAIIYATKSAPPIDWSRYLYPLEDDFVSISSNNSNTFIVAANGGNGQRVMASGSGTENPGLYWKPGSEYPNKNGQFLQPHNVNYHTVHYNVNSFGLFHGNGYGRVIGVEFETGLQYWPVIGFKGIGSPGISTLPITNVWTTALYVPDISKWVLVGTEFSARSTASTLSSSWESTTYPLPDVPGYNWIASTYDTTNNRIVAVSNSGNRTRMMISSDAISWELMYDASGIPQQTWTDVEYSPANDNIVAVSTDGTNRAISSTNFVSTVINSYWGAVFDTTSDRVFFGPHESTEDDYWLVINCENGLAVDMYENTSSLNGVSGENTKGIVQCPVSRTLYLVPHDYHTNIISINPDTYAITETANDFAADFVAKAYVGGVYHTDLQRIYLLPQAQINELYLHYIDCTDGSVKRYNNPFLNTEFSNMIPFSGGDYSPIQQRLYLAPNYTSHEWWYIDVAGNFVKYQAGNNELVTYSITNDAVYDSNTEKMYFGFSMLGDYQGNLNSQMYYLDAAQLQNQSLNYEIVCVEDNFNAIININQCIELTPACYEVELVSLSLPNVFLESGEGNRIAFYQYVYVQFESVTNPSSGTRNVFSSNNPVSVNKLFQVPISNVNSPDRATFVLLKSPMKHIIKVTPNDSFRFAVYLPNGELFTTPSDTSPPFPPNPDLQTMALFSFRRIPN